MNTSSVTFGILFAGVLLANMSYVLADGYRLKSNPFEGTGLQKQTELQMVNIGKSLDLRATLVAGSSSMANIGGKILQLGDVYQGYKLLAVEEGKAVLDFNGRTITKRMDEQQDVNK